MEVGYAASAVIPHITELTQEPGTIKLTGRLIDTEGMKMGNGRELFRDVRVAPDNPAAISKDTYNTTVFPMCLFVLVRELHLT